MPELLWRGKSWVQGMNLAQPARPSHVMARIEELLASSSLLFEGDNLSVLGLLSQTRTCFVDFALVDPPYNTGFSNWIYDDSLKDMRLPGDAPTESVVDSHDRWLCMMFPRIRQIRELVKDTGVVAVNVSDTEGPYARLLMDELFGEKNFLAQWAWCDELRSDLSSDLASVGVCTSYSLVYAKNTVALREVSDNRLDYMEILRTNFRTSLSWHDYLGDIFGSAVFPFPKNPGLFAEMIEMFTAHNKQSVILDTFAGSGTTAHAVMLLNSKDGGNRKFVLIEVEPKIAESITAERIRRVAKGYVTRNGEVVPGLGGDFTYCRLKDLLEESSKNR